MKTENRARPSSLFLLELTLAILLFSLASAVCVQLFVQSHLLSRQAEELHRAVNECTSLAELIRASDSMEECSLLFSQQYPHGEQAEKDGKTIFSVYYDADFTICPAGEAAAYLLSLPLTESDGILTAELLFSSLDEDSASAAIYELTVQHYTGRGPINE